LLHFFQKWSGIELIISPYKHIQPNKIYPIQTC